MPCYTKKGDDGYCSLIGGVRVKKCSFRICAIGEIDELCAHLELAALELEKKWRTGLIDLEKLLCKAGHDLALPPDSSDFSLNNDDLISLEKAIEPLENNKDFIKFERLGISRATALLNLARTAARRTERAVVSLAEKENINPVCLPFFNRISSYLYVLCKHINNKNKNDII